MSKKKMLAVLLLTGLTGCGTLTVPTDPNTFSVRDKTVTLPVGQTIALNNAYPVETKVIISELRFQSVDADMQALTGTAISILGRHLAKKRVVVAPQAAKTVTRIPA